MRWFFRHSRYKCVLPCSPDFEEGEEWTCSCGRLYTRLENQWLETYVLN